MTINASYWPLVIKVFTVVSEFHAFCDSPSLFRTDLLLGGQLQLPAQAPQETGRSRNRVKLACEGFNSLLSPSSVVLRALAL